MWFMMRSILQNFTIGFLQELWTIKFKEKFGYCMLFSDSIYFIDFLNKLLFLHNNWCFHNKICYPSTYTRRYEYLFITLKSIK